MSDTTIKDAVREKYSQIAIQASSCCGPTCGCGTDSGVAGQIIMNDLYDNADPAIRQNADLGLGCGTPAEFADLHPGRPSLTSALEPGSTFSWRRKKLGPPGTSSAWT